MSTPATYTLRPAGTPARRYYEDVARYADRLLAEANQALGVIAAGYESHLADSGVDSPISRDETLLEALTIGVLWRAHGAGALRVGGARAKLMESLARPRRDVLRPGKDCLRRPEARAEEQAARPRGDGALLLSVDDPWEPGGPTPRLEELERLVTWLAATGEYDEEVRRLERWNTYLASDPLGEWALAELVAFAIRFEATSLAALGAYTRGVEGFLRRRLPEHRWREDLVQCGRRRAEYHLNMVGAEILNRAWRAEFERAPRQVVALPACMRLLRDDRCRAERLGGGQLRCAGCTPRCAVAGVRDVASRAGAEVIAVEHGSDFGQLVRAVALHDDGTGLVGIACVPGLVGAGWKARAAGLPAQCVLLEYSGCRAHWDAQGVPTRIELAELARILGMAQENCADSPRAA
jgi:hypothetical protein